MFTTTEKIAFIEGIFGKGSTSRNQTNIEVLCPFCRDSAARVGRAYTKRKLAIRIADDMVHCWVCGFKARSLVSLIRKFGTADDLVRYRDKFAGTDRAKKFASEHSIESSKLPDGFRLLASLVNVTDLDAQPAIKYLRSRGITDKDLWYYKFGVSPVLPRRVIMPSFDALGQLNYYTTRAIDPETKPKYIDVDKELIEKTAVIFNEINIDWNLELNIVEGPFDLVKCPENTVPLQGNQMSEEHALFNSILLHGTRVCIMLDDDATARAYAIARQLCRYNIDICRAPAGALQIS